MNRYCRKHLSDLELVDQLRARVQRDWAHTAEMLADLAEVEERKLYAPAGYSTLHDYCVGELHMSEDVANKRIRAARIARPFPAIFFAIADGRLHLSGVLLLGTYLSPENAKGLLEAAAYKSKREIEQLLAARFPKSDVLTLATPSPANFVPAPGPVNSLAPASTPLSPASVLGRMGVPAARVTPLSPGSSSLQLTMPREMEEMLEHFKALVSHRIPSGDVVEVMCHALRIAIKHEEKQKFASTSRAPRVHRPSHDPRHIPMQVKSAVWLRDGAQCTFVSEAGKRCSSRRMLEFDHIVEVARGGLATVDNIRLRCRAHNQYTAEQTFGAGFMQEKREGARRAAAERRIGAEATTQSRATMERDSEDCDVTPWLRALGYGADQVRRAVAKCGVLPEDATLEDRVKAALRHLMPPHRSRVGGPRMIR